MPRIHRQEENLCHIQIKPQINNYEGYVFRDLQVELDEAKAENAALLSRCKVAEDLNKVYVRMYLEMQMKHDHLAKMCCESEENMN